MSEMTVLYYTAQREKPAFAARVIAAMLQAKGDAEVVSVSQWPLDLGRNIAVGDVGHSGFNAVRQIQIGAQSANTPFVAMVESDTLYPPEYYAFRPPRWDTCYLPSPTWAAFCQRGRTKFYSEKRRGFEGALVVARELLLQMLDAWGEGMPDWIRSDAEHAALVEDSPPEKYMRRHKPYHWFHPRERFPLPTPVLTIKTSENLHLSSNHDASTNTHSLEPWGEIHGFMQDWSI